jgi:hypothetical protein
MGGKPRHDAESSVRHFTSPLDFRAMLRNALAVGLSPSSRLPDGLDPGSGAGVSFFAMTAAGARSSGN